MLVAALLAPVGPAQAGPAARQSGPTFTAAAAFDTSKPLRDLAKTARAPKLGADEVRPDRGPTVTSQGHSPDAAVQTATAAAAIPAPLVTFEGLSSQDNFNIFGRRVNPPDPVGDVGPSHYVEMVNLTFAVYSKTGGLLLGPADTGALWADFPVDECTEPSGDPVVVYDQVADPHPVHHARARLSQRAAEPVLQLCRHFHDGRPDGFLLPLRLYHGLQLPRLSEVRGLARLLPDHDTRVRGRRPVDLRHRRLRARAQQDGQR